MVMRVNTNLAALNALRHLSTTEGRIQTNLERLSSGRKLNRAADSPAALVISEQMQSQIASTKQAISNSETSVSMMQTMEGALQEASNILINLRQLAVHAANEGTNDIKMLQADQSEIEHLLSTLNQIADNTQFGTRRLLDGQNAIKGIAVGDGIEFVAATEDTPASPSEGYKVNITQIPTRAMVAAQHRLTLDEVSPESNFSIVVTSEGKNASLEIHKDKKLSEKIQRIYFAAQQKKGTDPAVEQQAKRQAEETIQHLITTSLQGRIDEAGLNLEVMVYTPANFYGEVTQTWDMTQEFLNEVARVPEGLPQTDEKILVIRHREFGSMPSFTVTTTLNDFFGQGTQANKAIIASPGRDIEGTIGGHPELDLGEPALGNGNVLESAPGSEAEGLAIKYTKDTDDVLYQVLALRGFQTPKTLLDVRSNETLIGNEKPNGENAKIDGYVHLTQGALAFQVGPSQGQQTKIAVGSARASDLARNIENQNQFQSLADIDVTISEGAQDAMTLIDAAIDEVSTLRAKVGAFQKNALESNLNSLRIAHENLTAAESELADADMAEEMSSFTKNQILFSAGTAMLAQANQVPQSVLQLLGGAQS